MMVPLHLKPHYLPWMKHAGLSWFQQKSLPCQQRVQQQQAPERQSQQLVLLQAQTPAALLCEWPEHPTTLHWAGSPPLPALQTRAQWYWPLLSWLLA